jgi:hypothetical protein
MALRSSVSASSGDFTTSATKNGSAIFLGRVGRKVSFLSAVVSVLADTNTLTLGGKWQVSADNSTWVDVVESNNPANVVLATGTAGADTAVSKAIAAPDAVYGWTYARFCIVPGVATALAADTWSIAYTYRQLAGGDLA